VTVPNILESANIAMQIEHDMSEDMQNSAMILEKVKQDSYAQNLYAAMCNMQWQKLDTWPVLKNELWSVSWRSSGGIVAELRGEGDYLSWYCSGMGGLSYRDDDINPNFVPESTVTDEIRADLASLGWHPVPWEDDDLP
jgi:hypothetical protein